MGNYDNFSDKNFYRDIKTNEKNEKFEDNKFKKYSDNDEEKKDKPKNNINQDLLDIEAELERKKEINVFLNIIFKFIISLESIGKQKTH